MFGGHGLYYNGTIVGIIVDNALYLKAAGEVAKYFEAHGSRPFSYERNGKIVTMCYWRVPEDILEHQAELEEWVRRSI